MEEVFGQPSNHSWQLSINLISMYYDFSVCTDPFLKRDVQMGVQTFNPASWDRFVQGCLVTNTLLVKY